MMRIDRLDLIRYGAFKDRSLTFDPDARVTVVYGPNEAGKSTALAALGDLLFGFPQRSAAAFRFKTSELRLGGVIRGADGAALAFHRRKGAKAVLRAPEDDRPLSDDALAPFLGGLSEEAFRQLFALDSERLRKGGMQLLENGGELGETLLNASGAIANAEHHRADLAQKASELFNPARKAGKLPLYDAFGRYLEARKTFETARVTAREAEDARVAARQAGERLADARTLKLEAEDAAALMERAHGAAPRLRALDAAQADLARFADLEDAPGGKGALLARLSRDVEEAAQGVAEAELSRGAAAQRLHTAPEPGATFAERSAIEALAPLLTLAERAQAELPALRAARDAADAACALAARRLGVDRESLDRFQLSDAEMADLTRVIEEGRRLADQAEGVAQLNRERLKEASALVPEMREIGALFERAQGLADQVAAAENALAGRLATLPCFAGDAADLARLAPPAEPEITRFEAAFNAIAQATAQIRDGVKRRAAEREDIDAQFGDGAAAPPSMDDIASARSERDAEWSRIRAEKFSGETVSPPASPDRFEARLRTADDLSDRRAAEAERAERIAAGRRQRAQIDAADAKVVQEQERLARERDQIEREWRDAWPGLTRAPEPPGAMKGWPGLRAEILASAREFDRLRAARDEARAALDAALDAMARLGKLIDDPAPRPRAAREATGIVARWSDFLAAARKSADAAKALAAWRERTRDWSKRLSLADLRDDRGWLGAADAARQAAADAPRALADLLQANTALHKAEGQNQALVAAVDGIAKRLPAAADSGGGGLASDAAERAMLLARRWAAALKEDKARQDLREKLTIQLESAAAAHEKAQALLENRKTGLDNEAAALGVAPEEMPALIARLDVRDAAARMVETAERALLEAAGGRSPEALRAAIAERDDDALERDAEEKKHLAGAAGEEYEAAVRADEAAKRDAAALQSDRGASRAARAMEAAAAEGVDLAEEWLRLRAGDLLLAEAIRRYRDKTSNPMLERASTAFARLTAGSFSGLGAGFGDDGDERIVGLRPSGDAVEPAGMSEGARDQLFLALRIAAIERWSESRTAAPFVGDDLFASFDDERAGAAFKALAELGRSTQVLLFTHHHHMLDIARDAIGDALSVVRLDEKA